MDSLFAYLVCSADLGLAGVVQLCRLTEFVTLCARRDTLARTEGSAFMKPSDPRRVMAAISSQVMTAI